MRSITRPGLMPCSTSQPTPQRSKVPGRKFSQTMSERATRSLNTFAPPRTVQVEGERLLVPRLGQPGQRVTAAGRRPEVSEYVTADRILDLDHLGPELAEDAGAVRAGDDRGQIQHPQAGQRQLVLGSGGQRHQIVRSWRSSRISAAVIPSSSRITVAVALPSGGPRLVIRPGVSDSVGTTPGTTTGPTYSA